ncbi:MAG: hypothetical protein RI906_1171 [Pseudomonadota bacterium]|jgi:hypothetical protein
MADQSTFDSLCALLAQEGIDTVPQLSAELQSRLATDGRGWFYTDTVDTDPRDVSAWLDHLTQRTDDFFAAGFSGSGLSSVVFSLVVRQGAAMAVVEVAWGSFEDPDQRAARASARIGLTNSLLEEAAAQQQAGRSSPKQCVVAVEADLADLKAWAWVSVAPQASASESIAWQDGGLFAALQTLWALGPDLSDGASRVRAVS